MPLDLIGRGAWFINWENWATDDACMFVARRAGSKGFEMDRHE